MTRGELKSRREKNMAGTALERLSSISNLTDVWLEYRKGRKNTLSGVDGITIPEFSATYRRNIHNIRENIRRGYKFQKLKAIFIPKKGTKKYRLICVPTVSDRIVQRAVMGELEKRATKIGIDNNVSFGFVKDNPSSKRGVSAAREAGLKHRSVNRWAFKTDISSFFDSVDRENLMTKIASRLVIKSVIPILTEAINCEVEDSDSFTRRRLGELGIRPGRGLRQGMPLSPILSNFYLRDFDFAVVTRKFDMIRYADDLIIFCASKSECDTAQDFVAEELKKLNLELSVEKTFIKSPSEAVEFLGMEICPTEAAGYCLIVSDEQIHKIKENINAFLDLDYCNKRGITLLNISNRINSMIQGYKSAYAIADNQEKIFDILDEMQANYTTRILMNMFGEPKIRALSLAQRKFLLM